MSETAVVELREALHDAFLADPTMLDFLSPPGVYAGEATPTASLNYVVLGEVLRDADASYLNGQDGRAHQRRLSFWARTLTTAELMYKRAVTLLDGILLTVDGHTMQGARLEFEAGPVQVKDARKTPCWGVHARWTVKTLEV